MSNDKKEKVEETLDNKEFYEIKDMQDKLLYKTNPEELTDVLIGILSTGTFVKTFSLFKSKIELTYSSITDEERMLGYDLIRTNADKNSNNLSQIQLDSYNAKVSIALQLNRIKTNGNTTNLTQGSLEERVLLLSKMPEQQVQLFNKYLMIFANITSKAFASEEYLKNS